MNHGGRIFNEASHDIKIDDIIQKVTIPIREHNGEKQMNNNILATFVTYKNLYSNKNTDVYDIISEFARYVILNEHQPSYQQALFPILIEKYFDFQIPTLVLKPAIKRIEGVSLINKEYKIDYEQIRNHTDFKTLQDSSIQKTNLMISDVMKFLCEKISGFE